MIVPRAEMRDTIARLLAKLCAAQQPSADDPAQTGEPLAEQGADAQAEREVAEALPEGGAAAASAIASASLAAESEAQSATGRGEAAADASVIGDSAHVQEAGERGADVQETRADADAGEEATEENGESPTARGDG
jgi:hypothetical protein